MDDDTNKNLTRGQYSSAVSEDRNNPRSGNNGDSPKSLREALKSAREDKESPTEKGKSKVKQVVAKATAAVTQAFGQALISCWEYLIPSWLLTIIPITLMEGLRLSGIDLIPGLGSAVMNKANASENKALAERLKPMEELGNMAGVVGTFVVNFLIILFIVLVIAILLAIIERYGEITGKFVFLWDVITGLTL